MLSSKRIDSELIEATSNKGSLGIKEDIRHLKSVAEHRAAMDEEEASSDEETCLNVKERIAEFEQTITRSSSEKLLLRQYSSSKNGGFRSNSSLNVMAVSNSTDGSHESENERLRLEVEVLRKKLADTQSRPESWKFPIASECDKIKLDNSSHGMDSNGSVDTVNQLSTMKLILATRDDDQMRQDSDVEDDATTKTILAQLREQLRTLKTDAAQIARDRDDISGRLKASDIQLKEQIDTSAERAARVTELEQRVHEKDRIIDELRSELKEFMIEAEELVASQASLSAELEQKDEEMELQMESYAEALRLQAREQLSAALSRQTTLEAELNELRKKVDTEPAGNMNEGQLDYLHHIVFKYMSGVQQKQLVPVIATILKFTAAEMKAVMPPR